MVDEDLAGVARELLRVAPDAFVGERTDRSRALRPRDRSLAAAVAALRKPSPAAWVIDLLAEQGVLDEAVDLGPALRSAQEQADPGAIRSLRARRRELVESLARAGIDLAADAGRPVSAAVSAQVAATIEAAMADPRAGAAVRSGLLVRALESVGFEPVDLAGALAVPDAVPEAAEVPDAPGGDDLADLLRASRPEKPTGGRKPTGGQKPTGARGPTGGRTSPPSEPEPPARPDPRVLRDAQRAAAAAEQELTDLDAEIRDAEEQLRDAEEQLRAAEERLRDLEDRRGPLDRALREAGRALSRVERDAAG